MPAVRSVRDAVDWVQFPAPRHMNQQKGQIQIILGIVAFLSIVGVIVWMQISGPEEPSQKEEVTIENKEDYGAPIRSELLPFGALPSLTKTKISLKTDEASYCRYSKNSGTTYDSMISRFSYDKDKTSHTATASSLKTSQSYKYYVRCRDLAGNRNTDDLVIEFSVGKISTTGGGGTVSPATPSDVPPARTNLLPSGTLSSGTTKTTISLVTNEQAYCRYSKNLGTSYDSMGGRFSYDDKKLEHTATVSSLKDNKVYEYYVRCRDMAGNKNTDDAVIRFGIGSATVPSGTAVPTTPVKDITPPVMRSPSHIGDVLSDTTTSTVISISTDEQAECRYSTAQGTSYNSMSKKFTHYDETDRFHVATITGLQKGKAYDFFARCKDSAGNVNIGDVLISFRIGKY